MYINPIHAGTVALAQALALATRAPGRSLAGPSRHRFRPLQRLAQWWRELGEANGAADDPAQLMLWADCGGRPYVTALGGLLLMEQLRRKSAARRDRRRLAAAGIAAGQKATPST